MKKSLVAVVLVITGVIVGSSASAQVVPPYGTDFTPPTLTTGKPAFVVGNVLNNPNPDLPYITTDVQLRLTWSATDAVGVRSYALEEFGNDGGIGGNALGDESPATSYVATVSDYDDEQGGGSFRLDGWIVSARDYNGNTIGRRVYAGSGDLLGVTQEDGTDKLQPSNWGTLTYSGAWSQVNCACFLLGHTTRTSSLNARATFTRTYAAGDHVALVMAKGPGRGRAAIRVDGVIVATIDTYAAANVNRVVVFDRMMAAGTHTLSITNLATSGRSRIDLDAVLTN